MAFLPRAEGDGMDCEALKTSPPTLLTGSSRMKKKTKVNKTPQTVPQNLPGTPYHNYLEQSVPVAMSTPRAREQVTPVSKNAKNFTIATMQPMSILSPDSQLSFIQTSQLNKNSTEDKRNHSKNISILSNLHGDSYKLPSGKQLITDNKSSCHFDSSSDVSINISDKPSVETGHADKNSVVLTVDTSQRETETIPGSSTAMNQEVEELIRERDILIEQLETQTKV